MGSWSLGLREVTSLSMYYQYNPLLAIAYPPVQTPLPPALQHLRNLMLYKYLESLRHQENIIIQQESPIDLSINSIKQDRDCLGSTGSHSPRSNHSLNITNKLKDDEEESLKKIKKPKYHAKRLLPCDTCGKKFDR